MVAGENPLPKRPVLLIVTDIDGTLYSYGEWVLSQKNLFRSQYGGVLNPRRFLHESTDRVFKKYFFHIQERVRGLGRIFGKNQVIFYSGYPLTDMKRKLFKVFPLPVYSSFPQNKSERELRVLCNNRKVTVVIGDRLQDQKLARGLGALWRGYRFYEWPHFLTGPAYTRAFFKLVEKPLPPKPTKGKNCI